MGVDLRWIDGPWPGKLTIAARPRGGDWLEDEISDWKRAGVGAVLSLLTSDEIEDLGLSQESTISENHGLTFLSFPIADYQAPTSESELNAVLEQLNGILDSGKNAIVHCRQGVGRSGLVAACLLITRGFDPKAAMQKVSTARGVSVPETQQQREWIEHYAALLASSR